MSTSFSLVVYVMPPHTRPTSPSAIRIIPSALFTATSFGSDSWQRRSRLTSVLQSSQATSLRREPVHLLLDYPFNLADFLLDLAGEFFALAFGFQIGVVCDLSGFLFDVAF